MVCKDEVCQWFKNNEPHHRLELLCGLLNMCLPIELKFISTCVEDLGKRDFHDLRETENKANSAEEISQLSSLLDDRTRSKLVTYIALLSPVNLTCSSLLYKIIVEAQQSPETSISYVKEMLLIYTMVLHHPAFTYEQKRSIGDLHGSAKSLERQLCHHKGTDPDLVQVLSPSYTSSVADHEACDSGLSVGTETEPDAAMEGSGLLPTPTHLHRHFHDTHKHSIVAGVGSNVTSPLVGESGGSQDACSSGSGESGELYSDGGAVPTTYIYNSSMFEQQNFGVFSNDLLAVAAPSYPCSHQGGFHYYHQYHQVIDPTTPGSVGGGRGPISEGSSSEDNGAGGTSHTRPPVTTSPLSSPQSSPYQSPLQSLSPSRASSPWSRLNTTTTTTTTTTAAALPLVTSSTTSSVSSLSSTPSSPQLVHRMPAVAANQGIEMIQSSSTSPVTSQSSTSQVHHGKPPASGSRNQRHGDRSGSRTRVSGTPMMEVGTTPANQNQNLHSPSTARSISTSCGRSKNSSSSRWPANSSSPVVSSTSSSTTSSAKNVSRQSRQSPSLNCGTNPSRTPAALVATTSSSGCKSHRVSCHEGSGVTSSPSSMPNSSSAIVNTRNTVSQVGGGSSQEKNVHTVSNYSGARPSASVEGSSSAAHKSTSFDNSVMNNNILNSELDKNESFNKYCQLLSSYSLEDLKRKSDSDLLKLLMRPNDHEPLEPSIAKEELCKVRLLLTSWESSANHRPNGFSNPSSSFQSNHHHHNSHPHHHHHHHHHQHIPYTSSHGSSTQNTTTVSVASSSSSSPQTSVDRPSPSGTPNHTKLKTSGVADDTQNSSSAVSAKNTQVPPQNTVQVFPLDSSGGCNKTSLPSPLSPSSSQPTVSHKTALPYSQSSNVSSSSSSSSSSSTTASSSNTSSAVLDGESSSPPASVISTPIPLSSLSTSNVVTITTTTVSLSATTTTTANITTTTNVTQCHAYTVSPSQKMSLSTGATAPNASSSSSSASIASNQGSHVSSSTHNTSNSFSTNQTLSGVPVCVSPSNGVPHYMTTPPPPIHHKTPPLPPGQLRTPPLPMGAPPRTPSQEPSASSTSPNFIPTSGTQHMYHANSSGSASKNSSSLNNTGVTTPSTLPINGPGYNTVSGNVLSTTTSSSVHSLTTNISLPVYTSSGGIAVPPPSNGGLLPFVPPGGRYQPQAYLYHSVLGGGAAPGSQSYVPSPAYATQHPQRHLFIPGPFQYPHFKPTPQQSGAPIISGSSSRGGSSSSSSCSSSSSGSNRGFKKGIQRNGPNKVASHSSDSSPSSSQYSSPPQTPSPVHTGESNLEKRGGKSHGDVAENNGDGIESLTHPGSGASEDGTPPPLPPQPIQILPTAAPLRHRYMPYQHFPVWPPQAGMLRLPMSLPTQGPGVAPRNPVPLTSDKSSRETTPPAPVTLPVVQQDPQCCIRSPADGSTVSTTSNGSSIHGRNGGSPLTAAAPSHHESSLPPPPPPPPAHNPVPSVASAPAGQIPPGNTCAGAPHTSVQYNAAGYPMFVGTQMFPHFPGFVPSHSSALSNGFVPHSIPPNFHFAMGGNGMNAEFMYGGQYPLMSSGTSQSGGGAAPACGTPTGIAPSSTPGSGLTASLPYPHFPPTLPHTHNPSAGAKKTCYNCGQPGHRGAECKEASIEEMCKRTKDRSV